MFYVLFSGVRKHSAWYLVPQLSNADAAPCVHVFDSGQFQRNAVVNHLDGESCQELGRRDGPRSPCALSALPRFVESLMIGGTCENVTWFVLFALVSLVRWTRRTLDFEGSRADSVKKPNDIVPLFFQIFFPCSAPSPALCVVFLGRSA